MFLARPKKPVNSRPTVAPTLVKSSPIMSCPSAYRDVAKSPLRRLSFLRKGNRSQLTPVVMIAPNA